MSEEQTELEMEGVKSETVEKYKFEPIKGYPMLNWHGKRPFTSTHYYPAQKKEVYGEEVHGWINKIFWGDNLQVMSHLLKEYRGKVDLIYIDPPFDSKADYKKQIKLKNTEIQNNSSSFEEKQYTDIWSNDEYLQFMYERILLIRELLSPNGSIYLHCDYRKVHHLRMILDEVFGESNFINQIIWRRRTNTIKGTSNKFSTNTDYLLFYSKSDNYFFDIQYEDYGDGYKERFKYEDEYGKYRWQVMATYSEKRLEELKDKNRLRHNSGSKYPEFKQYLHELKGRPVQDIWSDINMINAMGGERLDYPTQKPESLIERIIKASTKKGSIVFDCFMGSGTAQASAMKLGRKFIGADINVGAIQTTTRLNKIAKDLSQTEDDEQYYTSFEVYNVNHYDVFRNPVEAKDLLIAALEIDKLDQGIYDGEKDSYKVKIMPVNRIATREDLNELLSNFPTKVFEKRKEEAPNKPVESVMLVCMGHEPDLKAHLEQESGYKLDVKVVDILRDKANIEFKRDSEAKISTENNKLIVENFYPMNLLQKLSLQKESVSEWRELVETIMIDWNYDGAVMEPAVIDIPGKSEFVKGEYDIPSEAGNIKIKITDLLSESYEEVINHG